MRRVRRGARHGNRAQQGISLVLCMLVLSFALAACGSSGGSSSDDSSTAARTEGSEKTVSSGGSSSMAEAKKVTQEYSSAPTEFPADEPLKTPAPAGLKIAYLDCGSTTCAIIRQVAEGAVEAAGGDFIDVKAGVSAATVNSAANAVLGQDPDIILNGGIDPTLWRSSLEKIEAEEIPVISTGITETGSYGLEKYPNTNVYGSHAGERAGMIQANFAYSEYGDGSNYMATFEPEISATNVAADTIEKEMERLCSDCSVEPLPIKISEEGTTAPANIVSKLQAESGVSAVIATADTQIEGLPTALSNAGLDTEIIGSIGTPTGLQYVKEGKEKGLVALDLTSMVWSMVDAGLRAQQGQPFSKPEAEGYPVMQLLTQKAITFDPIKGWLPYPEFAERFTKLWKGE
jgi:ABC-type sugar transport system substrate-binding protein